MKPEARVIKDVKKKIYYKEGIEELTLDQSTTMLRKLKVLKEEYGGFTGYDYRHGRGCAVCTTS